MNHYLTN